MGFGTSRRVKCTSSVLGTTCLLLWFRLVGMGKGVNEEEAGRRKWSQVKMFTSVSSHFQMFIEKRASTSFKKNMSFLECNSSSLSDSIRNTTKVSSMQNNLFPYSFFF